MDTDAGRHLDLQPPDRLRHKVRRRLLGEQDGHIVIAGQGQDIFIGRHAAAVHQAGDLAGEELIKDFHLPLLAQGRDERALHRSHGLDPLMVKMVEKTCQLQCRPVHLRMGQDDLIRIQIRCGIF